MSGGSYIRPVEARSTVRADESSDQDTPARGATLFLSIVNFCEYGFAANGRAGGTSKRSYRMPYNNLIGGPICQSSCAKNP